MKRKKVNYDDIINKLDDYLKSKNDVYGVILIFCEGERYKKVTE